MIVYSGSKKDFLAATRTNTVHLRIQEEMMRKLGRRTAESEVSSWRNSMQFMANILDDTEVPDDSGVAIEYNIPGTGKRIDFIVTGIDEVGIESAVIIELKQWSSVKLSDRDAIVISRVGLGERDLVHPSYQAWSYVSLIENFNSSVYESDVRLLPCAYLHNLDRDDVIRHAHYEEYLKRAPVFISSDHEELKSFIKQHVRYGDRNQLLYRIENGKLKPSKILADSLAAMLAGNQEFVLIDDQKLVYEAALSLAEESGPEAKNVLIIEGGPGTGKSVVAVNLLVELTSRRKLVQYVSKNSAPREVYAARLTGNLRRTVINNLFKGSGSYYDCPPNTFSTLVVDEAHRLNAKSGLYANKGNNQISEIIAAAHSSIFFVDDAQVVTFQDIGEVAEIERCAIEAGARVSRGALQSQFRCNGSDGYLAWIDNTLQIRETENRTLEGIAYDFRVVSDPNILRSLIEERNLSSNKARIVAGYCWDWKSKRVPSVMDIVIPEANFEARWNLADGGAPWLIAKESVKEVGCIHTCQGLELEYVGVIFGLDLVVRGGKVLTDGFQRSRHDKSIRGFKKLFKADPKLAAARADRIIKNTYRTLMTRGQIGCFVYSVDAETQEYLRTSMLPQLEI